MHVAPVESRFWARVRKTDACWLWTGQLSKEGYGCLSVDGRKDLAHRVSYRLNIGPIPPATEIDHLCRVRHCVNPVHLEAVPHRVNVLRGASPVAVVHRTGICLRGHPMVEGNLHWNSPTSKTCARCRRACDAERYRRIRDAQKTKSD